MQNSVSVGKCHKPEFFLKNPLTFSAECSRINKSVEDSGSQKTSGSPTISGEWEHSSAGRASALQAEGHRFEPYCSHHYGLVVQLVRTLACHARGRRFDPDPGRQFASVAQSVEQGTENPRVIGSIPIGGTINADVAHPVERHLAKVEVASSSLVIRSKKDA